MQVLGDFSNSTTKRTTSNHNCEKCGTKEEKKLCGSAFHEQQNKLPTTTTNKDSIPTSITKNS